MLDELIEVLTPEGKPTGRRKPKADIHRDGDWHRAIHVWIVTPDDQILLQRRSIRKENNPGLWDVSAAGHVSAGEDLLDSAVREVREELGLTLRPDELRHIATLRQSCVLNRGTYFDNEWYEIFIVRGAVDLRQLILQPEEVDEAALVTIGEFRERVTRHDPTLVPHDEEYALLLATTPTTSSPPPGGYPYSGGSRRPSSR